MIVITGWKDVQERVGKHERQREDHKEPEGGVDQGHVKWTAIRRAMIDEEGNVGIHEQEDDDTEEDSREEEHAQDL